MTLPAVPFYALASGLVGFRSDRLRVRVSEVRSGYAWVRTADLIDAGTPLTLDIGQITPLDECSWARPDKSAPVRVASIQTLVRRELPPADVIVIDEAHHA